MALMNAVGDALTTIIGFVGEVVTALVGEAGSLKDLLPLFAIGIAIAVFAWAFRAIRDVIWGA